MAMKRSLTQEKVLSRTVGLFLILLCLLFVGIFILDGYVIHSIPASKDQYFTSFHLDQSDEAYANWNILDESFAFTTHTYLVERDGEVHLLFYDIHFMSNRGKLVQDFVVDANEPKTYELKTFLYTFDATIHNGELEVTQGKHLNIFNRGMGAEILVYTLTAATISAVVSVIYYQVRMAREKKKNPGNTNP